MSKELKEIRVFSWLESGPPEQVKSDFFTDGYVALSWYNWLLAMGFKVKVRMRRGKKSWSRKTVWTDWETIYESN